MLKLIHRYCENKNIEVSVIFSACCLILRADTTNPSIMDQPGVLFMRCATTASKTLRHRISVCVPSAWSALEIIVLQNITGFLFQE